MIVKECAFCSKETLLGNPSEGTCNLSYNGMKFFECESIPISQCPYKLFICGKIDKEELNKRIKERLRK